MGASDSPIHVMLVLYGQREILKWQSLATTGAPPQFLKYAKYNKQYAFLMKAGRTWASGHQGMNEPAERRKHRRLGVSPSTVVAFVLGTGC